MYQDKMLIVEESDLIYIIAHRETQQVLAGNKLARIFYNLDTNDNFINLREIFSTETESLTNMLSGLPKIKYIKLLDIKSNKNNGDLFDCDVEMRFLDEANDVIYMVITEKNNNDSLIKRCIELSKKVEHDQQYFEVMQDFSKDLFFRIDIKKKTMVHRGDITNIYGLIPVVENYPESMLENEIIHPDDLDGYMKFAYDLMKGIPGVYEARVKFNNRTYESYKLQGKAFFDSDGNVVQMIGKSENIQKLVSVRDNSSKDVLSTSLNKEAFEVLTRTTLDDATDKDKFAYLLIDFDEFKQVNQKLGNIYGDFTIETACKRIMNCIRETDKVGRVGVDQFAILFSNFSDKDIILERAKIIQKSLNKEFSNGDHSYKIQVSMGISFFPENGTTYAELHENSLNVLQNSRKKTKN